MSEWSRVQGPARGLQLQLLRRMGRQKLLGSVPLHFVFLMRNGPQDEEACKIRFPEMNVSMVSFELAEPNTDLNSKHHTRKRCWRKL